MQVVASPSEFTSASGNLSAMKVNENKTAKLFHMMSSTLYTDKYMSILRELCSNARDSHAEAGKLDTPFAIIAPSHDNLFLTVSDVGTGITYEKAKCTILEFLSSTKDEGQDADKFVGGWGIGAKVPRAYTDNYQVHLRKDGVEWIVQIINDAAGLPFEMLMAEHKTNKPDGVDFVVPIQPVHVSQWRSKVESYLETTNYNVIAYTGSGEVKKPRKPYRSFDFEGFSLDVQDDYSYSKSLKVIYGGMVYPIPEALGVSELEQGIYKKVQSGMTLYLRFDEANSLRCGLSREQLEVDEANKQVIYRALLQISDELDKCVVSDLHGKGLGVHNEWSVIQDASDAMWKQIEETGQQSPLAAIAATKSFSAQWMPREIVRKAWKRGEESTDNVNVKYSLPLPRDFVLRVKVVYSDKLLTKKDIAGAEGQYQTYQTYLAYCPIKTKDEAVAQEWAKTLTDIVGAELAFEYVESSRVRSARSRSLERYAVCAVTGKRAKLDENNPVVMLTDPSKVWQVDLTGATYFVPTKSFKVQNAPEGSVITQDEYLAGVDLTEAKKELEGCKTDKLWVQALELADDVLANVYGNIPDKTSEEKRKIQKKLRKASAKLVHARKNLCNLEEKFGPQDLTGVQAELDYTKLLKEANHCYVNFEYNKDLFAVIDVDNIAKQYKEGNPEAMRLFFILNLEKFL